NAHMSLQRTLPVVVSILIILAVAVLRDRSRTLAAILAVMPINIPLALWVIASDPDGDPKLLSETIHSMFFGLLPGLVWLGVVLWAVRAGWHILPAIVAGYAIWLLLIAALFVLGVLSLPGK
ncbi:MAG: hypothetical protein NZM11_12305, partial [Anaerolineales bacterium]|nr:hypothetical protein [Anaerolineales bacterium]